jgi:hypothetical protein
MSAWLKKTFPVLSNGFVVVYTSDSIQTAFDPSDPAGYFTNISPVPSHTALSALPCAAEGWQKIFDQWKANGVVD